MIFKIKQTILLCTLIIAILLITHIKRSNKKSVNVFFDLGANMGDSIENFLGIRDLGGGGNMRNRILPGKLLEQWTIYAIEGNSVFNDKLHELKAKLSTQHNFILLNGTVVTTYDGFITFYIDKVNENVNFWGSSIFKDHPDVVSSNYTKETLPCVNLARLLRQYTKNDYVVVKMDIEGAEFDLLLHLIKENVLHLIDVLFIEYHWYLMPFKTPVDLFNKIFQLYNIRVEDWN